MGMNDFEVLRHTSGARFAVTGAAADITLPRLDTSPEGTPPGKVVLRAPSANTDVIHFEAQGTATTSSPRVSPGTDVELRTRKKTLSVLAASASQNLDVFAYYA